MRKVNWKNPIARNLVACITGESLHNIITKHGGQFSSLVTVGTSNTYYKHNRDMHRFNYDTGFYATRADYNSLVGTNVRSANTQLIFMRPHNASDVVPHDTSAIALGEEGYLSFHSNSNNGVKIGGNYAGTWYSSFASKVIPAGRWVVLAFRFDGQTIDLWIDGEQDVINTGPTGPNTTGDGAFNISGGINANGDYLRADIALALIWDRALSDAEMARMGKDPFQVLDQHPIIGVHQLPTNVKYATVKVPWTEKPPIGTPLDLDNPLTRGLRHFWAVVPGGVQDLTGRAGFTPLANGGYIGSGKAGLAYNNPNDGEYIDLPDISTLSTFTTATGFTMAVCMAPTATTAWAQPFGTNGDFQTIHYGDNNDLRSMGLLGTGYALAGIPITVLDGRFSVFGAAWKDGSSTCDMFRFLAEDGKNFQTDIELNGGATGTANFSQPIIGQDLEQATRTAHGSYYWAALWDRAIINESEQKALAENPWQIFKPKEIMVPINEDLPELAIWEEKWSSEV